MSTEKTDSIPAVVSQLHEEARRKHFQGGGICEIFIDNERTGGGEIQDISVKEDMVCAILSPFFQLVEGRWTVSKEYTFIIEGTEAWREGEDLLVEDMRTKTVAAFRVSLWHLRDKHRKAKQHAC